MPDLVTHRRAVVALLLLVPVPTVGSAVGLWLVPGAVGKAVYTLCKLWILALPALWLLFVERGRPSLSPVRRGGFGIGVLSGLVIGAAILGVYRFYAAAQIDTGTLRGLAAANGFDQPAVFLTFAAYLTLVNSVLEEYVWRWFVFTRCKVLMPAAGAVVVAALFFTLHHVVVLRSFLPWELTALGAAGVFVGGAAWSWCYLRYASIWPGYVSHAIVDAAILAVGWDLLFNAPS